MKYKPLIGVIGGSEANPIYIKQAYQVGKLLTEQGAILVCGGLGGIMEAACKGATEAGGATIGILPMDNPKAANDYVTIPIATGIGTARNKVIINTAEAFIAIDGKYGTLSEIAYALDVGKTVAGLGTWDIEGVIAADAPQKAVDIVMGNYND
ncbi:MAG: TIGR00725 family protein [candidate division Zixibacteria bacterium]|nr:TIGR00725 family protein [candidate division Zixibacteria bacterium]